MKPQDRSVTIIEIRRRAEQGITLPFYCRGNDHKWYWVKGNLAGKRALCCEWLAGRIGQALGLYVPPFAQVIVPRKLIEFSTMEGISDLGAGVCFGSEHVQNASEFTLTNLDSVDQELQRRLLVFDWWIQNEDRILGPHGGNVNLLWSVQEPNLHVIDHNISFSDTFDMDRFRKNHVFAANLADWHSSFALALAPIMADILARLKEYWEEFPEEWVEAETLSSTFSFDRVKAVLERFTGPESIFGGQIR